MAITLVGSNGNTGAGTALFTVGNITGLAVDDWLVAILIHRNGTGVAGTTSDQNFTQVGTRVDIGTIMSAWVFEKKVTQADVDATQFSWTMDPNGSFATTAYALTLTAWRGVGNRNTHSSGSTETASTTVTYAGLTPTVDDCLLVPWAGVAGNALVTDIGIPNGAVEEIEVGAGTSNGNVRRSQQSYQVLTGGANQAVAAKTATLVGGSSVSIAGMVALAPTVTAYPTAELRPSGIFTNVGYDLTNEQLLPLVQRDVP